MSLEREAEPLDFILVMGTDNEGETGHQEFYKQISSLCKSRGLRYRIIGDGKTLVNLEELGKLPTANNVAILGHGSISNGLHKIVLCKDNLEYSLGLVTKIQQQTHTKNILFCSCYGGNIVSEVKKSTHPVLNGGTNLFAPSPDDDLSWQDNNQSIIVNYINKINPSEPMSMIPVVLDAIKTISQTLVYIAMPDYPNDLPLPLRSLTLHRTAREVHDEVETLCDWKINSLNEYIDQLMLDGNYSSLASELRHTIPHFDAYYKYLDSDEQIKLLSSKMTEEQIQKFQKSSLTRHVRHNDVKVVDKLLDKTTFEPNLLAEAIIMHRIRNYNRNTEKMVDTILKHGNNATHGQNVNSFAPDASLFDYIELYKEYGNKMLLLLFYTPLTLALAENECKISNMPIIQFSHTNYNVVELLLDRGADMYLPDALGKIPAVILSHLQLPLFRKDKNKIKAMNKRTVCAEIFLNALSETDQIPLTLLTKQIKDALSKKAELNRICQENNDADFFDGNAYPPKSKQVFEAYKKYSEAADRINIKDLLNIAKENGKPDTLNTLLENAFDPLWSVAQQGDLATVNTLLDYGVNVDEYEPHLQRSPLDLAIFYRHLDVVNALIEKGADIHTPYKGLTPLLSTAYHGQKEIFYALLQEDIKRYNIVEQDWQSLLFLSIEKMPLEVIEDLLSRCKTKNIRNANNETLFDVVIRYSRDDLLELFMDEALINVPDKENIFPLHTAIKNSNKKMFETLLKHGADINIPNEIGNTPLHLAAVKGNTLITKTLLNVGANPNTKNRDGETPVQLALRSKWCGQSAMLILAHDPACLNQVDAEGRSLLYYARSTDTFNDLMKLGLKWHNAEEAQSLFMAKCGGHEIWEMLLNEGANIDTPNNDGHTALDLAEMNGDYSKVHFIRNKAMELNKAKNLQNQMTEQDWNQQRLSLINTVKTQIKNNMDYLGITTKNPDKKILLNNLMNILLYKDNLEDQPSREKLSEFPEIASLHKDIILHMEKRSEIKKDITPTNQSISFGKK